MIKSIHGGKYINISGGFASDPYISPGTTGSGMLRWNSNMNCVEVNDGVMWKSFNTTVPTVDLTPEAQSILDWAKHKMEEERKLDGLCEKYPGLRNARDNFETFKRLVQSESA